MLLFSCLNRTLPDFIRDRGSVSLRPVTAIFFLSFISVCRTTLAAAIPSDLPFYLWFAHGYRTSLIFWCIIYTINALQAARARSPHEVEGFIESFSFFLFFEEEREEPDDIQTLHSRAPTAHNMPSDGSASNAHGDSQNPRVLTISIFGLDTCVQIFF